MIARTVALAIFVSSLLLVLDNPGGAQTKNDKAALKKAQHAQKKAAAAQQEALKKAQQAQKKAQAARKQAEQDALKRAEAQRKAEETQKAAQQAAAKKIAQSQKKKAAKARQKAAKALKKKVNQAVKQELNLQEVTVMRYAHALLTGANANYDGHRVKAMKHLNEAIGILKIRIDAKGLPEQEMKNIRDQAVTAYFKSLRKTAPRELEPQVLSDAQLYQSGQLLTQMRGMLVIRNQPKLLGLVDGVLLEINAALQVSATR